MPKVKYEGSKSSNPFAFWYYNPEEEIVGKSMREHLKFALFYWHTLCGDGTDMFGRGTVDKSMHNREHPYEKLTIHAPQRQMPAGQASLAGFFIPPPSKVLLNHWRLWLQGIPPYRKRRNTAFSSSVPSCACLWNHPSQEWLIPAGEVKIAKEEKKGEEWL